MQTNAMCLRTWWLRLHCLCKGIVDFGYESLTVVIRQLVDFIDLIAQLLAKANTLQ